MPTLLCRPHLEAWLVPYLEALATIADSAETTAHLPDLAALDQDEVRQTIALANVLRGGQIDLLANDLRIALPADDAQQELHGPERPRQLRQTLTANVDGVLVVMGEAILDLPPCTLTVDKPAKGQEGDVRVTVRAAPDAVAQLKLA